MPILYLIDAFAYIYRAHYANPHLTNGAAFFFTRTVQSILQVEAPTHIGCVFDVNRGSRYRYALHPNYKAGRNERPPALDMQLPMIKDIVDFLGLHRVEFQGAEADDVIATLATRATKEGFDKVVILTPDKDLLQLVDDAKGISVQAIRDGITTTMDAAGVWNRLWVKPEQVVGYLTLVGDTSDNVPGVQGIGEKGAAGLLQQYGTLEGVVANRGKLKAAYKAGIEAAMPHLAQSQKLVTVIKDLDLRLPGPMLEHFAYIPPSAGDQRKFFTDLKFPSLAPERTLDELDSDFANEEVFDDI